MTKYQKNVFICEVSFPMLSGKTVVVGVSGGIAAYKMANVVSKLKKLNADVHVILTEHACHFINPITFETLTNNK